MRKLFVSTLLLVLIVACNSSDKEIHKKFVLNNDVVFSDEHSKAVYSGTTKGFTGVLTVYFEDTQRVLEETQYKDGHKSGDSKVYYEDGGVHYTSKYLNEVVLQHSEYDTNNKLELEYSFDSLNDEHVVYKYKSGVLTEKSVHKNKYRDNTYITYYPSGVQERVREYTNLNESGKITEYSESGAVRSVTHLQRDEVVQESGTVNDTDAI